MCCMPWITCDKLSSLYFFPCIKLCACIEYEGGRRPGDEATKLTFHLDSVGVIVESDKWYKPVGKVNRTLGQYS